MINEENKLQTHTHTHRPGDMPLEVKVTKEDYVRNETIARSEEKHTKPTN